MFFRLAAMLMLGAIVTGAQETTQGFVIDPSKPFAYLKFDHVGDRKPLPPDEVHKGLWLRLVNNSRIPIKIEIFDPGTGDPGKGVYDEIIPVATNMTFHGILPPGQRRPTEQVETVPREGPLPKGYAQQEVTSSTLIAPGRDLLFSVPLNHVSPSWYLQVKFHFQLPGARTEQAPLILVDFGWPDIPKEYREEARH